MQHHCGCSGLPIHGFCTAIEHEGVGMKKAWCIRCFLPFTNRPQLVVTSSINNNNIVRNEMIAQVKHSIPDEQLFFDLNEDNSDVEENKVHNNVVEVVEEAKQGSNEENVIIIRNDPVVDVGSVLDDDVKVDQVDLVDEVEEGHNEIIHMVNHSVLENFVPQLFHALCTVAAESVLTEEKR